MALAPFAEVLLNEARLAWRTPRGLIFGLGLPAVMVVIFGELPKMQVRKSSLGGLTMFSVEVPVLITFVIAIMALYSLPVPLASYRELGILRRLAVTPARPTWVLAAQVVVNLVFAVAGLLIVLIVLVVGAAAFGESAQGTWGGFILAVVPSLAAVFAIGLAIAALAKSASTAHAIGGRFPTAAVLLTLAGYAAIFGFVAARYFRWE